MGNAVKRVKAGGVEFTAEVKKYDNNTIDVICTYGANYTSPIWVIDEVLYTVEKKLSESVYRLGFYKKLYR